MDQPALAGRAIAAGAACAPIPAWVALELYDIPATANPHFVAGGLCVLLDESQIDLCGPERAWFHRRADLIIAPTGAESAAQFDASFDPAFERLEIHSISVIRDGQTIDHTQNAVFDTFRRERNMERLVFDGRITVHLTLPDVRPGDVVETAYTHYGVRKSLGGRHGTWTPLEWSVGIVDVRIRLRTPSTRTIVTRGINGAPEPNVTEKDGITDRSWRTLNRPGIRFEPLTPDWIPQNAAIQFSEWRDWADVCATFAPLYEEETRFPPDLEAEIKRIEETETTQARRAAAILRFVQSLRYLAISMGEGGYTPRKLADICATRYGDCKDKTKLFVAMARRLGVNACPALVNTIDGRALDTWLPSAPVFDHCIVRVEIEGKVYWLDGTHRLQPSPLETLGQCYFGWALPLKPGVTALERMPDPSMIHALECDETITLGDKPADPVRYEWWVTSRRGRAEFVRDTIAREGEVGMFKTYTQDIQRVWPKATPVQQRIERDDVAANIVTLRESYDIGDAWTKQDEKSVKFGTLDLFMRPTLATLVPGERKFPIYLGNICRITRRVEIKSDRSNHTAGWNIEIECPQIRYTNTLSKQSPTGLVLEQSIETRAHILPAADAEKYRAIIADLEKSDVVLVETLDKKGRFIGSAPSRSNNSNMRWIWWLVRLAILGGLAASRYFAHN